jgi:hypothetical protein
MFFQVEVECLGDKNIDFKELRQMKFFPDLFFPDQPTRGFFKSNP